MHIEKSRIFFVIYIYIELPTDRTNVPLFLSLAVIVHN